MLLAGKALTEADQLGTLLKVFDMNMLDTAKKGLDLLIRIDRAAGRLVLSQGGFMAGTAGRLYFPVNYQLLVLLKTMQGAFDDIRFAAALVLTVLLDGRWSQPNVPSSRWSSGFMFLVSSKGRMPAKALSNHVISDVIVLVIAFFILLWLWNCSLPDILDFYHPCFIPMASQLLSIPFFLIFLVFVFLLVKKVMAAKKSTLELLPGPWKLPLIGNMHQLLVSLPHHSLRDLAKKHGPLMHLKLGEVSAIVVSSSDVAKEIMKTHDIIFSQRYSVLASYILSYECTDIVFSPYGDYWRQLRKICVLELLSAKRVESFRSIREEEVSKFIRTIYLSAGSPTNLSDKIFSLTYGITSKAAFSKKSKGQEMFISIIKEAVKLSAGFNFADMYPSLKFLGMIGGLKAKIKRLHQVSDMILEDIVNEHRERRATRNGEGGGWEDLVDVLLNVQERGGLEFLLSDDNIKAVILDIFSAGSETSSTAVEWAISEMLKNPRVMKKAQAEVREVYHEKGTVDESRLHELDYVRAVIRETLRLHPSAPLLLPRESRERCEIIGYEVPPQTRVIINAWAIARDPEYWNDADKFIPERFLNSSIDFKGTTFEYIPFGAGRRVCPGILYAIANIQLPLAQLLFHFDWKLPGGLKEEDLDMTEHFGVTVRRKWDLHLIPIPYQLSSNVFE
ncbi:cytochrome P450 71D10-like [Malania oleifera]|uniref:cytochrome P450 71D10-like n=1 Tax=Malania oleifera TaxID=397392 RepID=UPI0025AE0C25|nr:cytochrome P450 71D10-like [Malania oleifera]